LGAIRKGKKLNTVDNDDDESDENFQNNKNRNAEETNQPDAWSRRDVM